MPHLKPILNNFPGGLFIGFLLTMIMTSIIFGSGTIHTSAIRTGTLYIDGKAFQIKELK